jgi:uncharacterized repeat protein (TIGR01451 family)
VGLEKTATPPLSALTAGSVTYGIHLYNSDVVSHTAISLTDTLPEAMTFADWIVRPTDATVAQNAVTWGGDIMSGERITFTFVATYTGDYGTIISNTATLSTTRLISDTATFGIMRLTYLPLVTRQG